MGMWVFLVTEVLFFGGLFTGYTYYRCLYPDAWMHGSRYLDVPLGAINTVVLITSSLFMAIAVRSAQLGARKMLTLFLWLTILAGGAFLCIKFFEYHHKFEEHLVPGRDFVLRGSQPREVQLFFSFYFAMTGLHAVHMIVGIVLIAVFSIAAWRGRFSPAYFAPVETLGLYWHFVDIIWIFLFPLLYLVGHH